MNDTKIDEEKYQAAKRRVEEIKGFYGHLFSYIGVNVVLLIIDMVTGLRGWWFYWVTAFWGIGLFWHAMGVFVFYKITGGMWEKRKIKEVMDEMEKSEKEVK